MRAVAVLSLLSFLLFWASTRGVENDLFGEEEENFFHDEKKERPGELKRDPNIIVYREMEKASACPKGFVFNWRLGFCFKVIDKFKGHIRQGQILCSKLTPGGRLVQLNTKDKFDVVEKYIMSRHQVPSKVYILGAFARNGASYKWLTGEKITINKWCPGAHKKPCVRLINHGGHSLCLDGACCVKPKYFICEKPIN